MVLSCDVASARRSEEHTSELQSQSNLVCRLLLEKKQRLVAGRGPAPAAPVLRRSGAGRARGGTARLVGRPPGPRRGQRAHLLDDVAPFPPSQLPTLRRALRCGRGAGCEARRAARTVRLDQGNGAGADRPLRRRLGVVAAGGGRLFFFLRAGDPPIPPLFPPVRLFG